jgi:septation ring formation regulator EzrA
MNMAINVEQANAAIADLEKRLSELRVPAEKLSDIHSDIATIKAQLAKSTPSHSIVREAAHSIRKAVHEIAGEMISPAATAAITALGKVTGAF